MLGARSAITPCFVDVSFGGALTAIKVDDSTATKGPTGAQGLVHGGRKNKQFIWEKRSSPLRPPLAATQKELDSSAIYLDMPLSNGACSVAFSIILKWSLILNAACKKLILLSLSSNRTRFNLTQFVSLNPHTKCVFKMSTNAMPLKCMMHACSTCLCMCACVSVCLHLFLQYGHCSGRRVKLCVTGRCQVMTKRSCSRRSDTLAEMEVVVVVDAVRPPHWRSNWLLAGNKYICC